MSHHIPAGRAKPRILHTRIAPLAAAAVLTALGESQAGAQDSGALIDALVREGVLTQEKAENIRTDLQRDLAATSAGKIKLSNSVTELKLYGDLRLRYQYDDRQPQLDNGSNVSQQSRYRFRLRLNAEAKLGRDWAAGFSLGTGQPSDSEEQTFENGFDDYNIYVTKAYLSWKPNDWLSVTAGKQKDPFYTTDLIWDPDITPTGLSQTIAFHKFDLGGAAGSAGGYGKDGKAGVEPAAKPEGRNWELTLVAGQFIFDDNQEFNFDSDASTDGYLFVEQLIATYKFNKDTSITVAPGFYTFTAADLSGLTNANPFQDAADYPAIQTQLVTTTTERERLIVTYGANGRPLAATASTNRQSFSTVVDQQTTPSALTGGQGSQGRTVTTNQVRTGPLRALSATELAALPSGPPGGQSQIDSDAVTVDTTVTPIPSTAVSGETRQLHILTAPGEVAFNIGSLKSKLYWDFAYNFGGRERFNDIYQLRGNPSGHEYSTRDGIAWLAGLQVGETKKKGDWSATVNYRETGIASVDPNLNDSNFGLGELNTRGFKIALAYQLADPVVFSLTGFIAYNIDKDLTGGRATSAGGVAESNTANVIQADLSIKF